MQSVTREEASRRLLADVVFYGDARKIFRRRVAIEALIGGALCLLAYWLGILPTRWASATFTAGMVFVLWRENARRDIGFAAWEALPWEARKGIADQIIGRKRGS